MKKSAAVLVLCFCAFCLAGCQTAKGATTGIALTAKGAVEDSVGLFGALMKFDQWIRDNVW